MFSGKSETVIPTWMHDDESICEVETHTHSPSPSSHILSTSKQRQKAKVKDNCFWRSEGFWPLLCRLAQCLRLTGAPKEARSSLEIAAAHGRTGHGKETRLFVSWIILIWRISGCISNIIPQVPHSKDSATIPLEYHRRYCKSVERSLPKRHSSSDLPWSSRILQVF